MPSLAFLGTACTYIQERYYIHIKKNKTKKPNLLIPWFTPLPCGRTGRSHRVVKEGDPQAAPELSDSILFRTGMT